MKEVRTIFDKDFFEIFSSKFISLIAGLFAGFMLALFTDKLVLIPGVLVLLPGFLELQGNMSGTFASRLSSGLFLKVLHPNMKITNRVVRGNVLASLVLAIIVATVLGLLAFLFNYAVLGLVTPFIIVLPLIASLIASVLEIPLTFMITMYLFRKGHDPNNIMGPFSTSIADFTSVIALLITFILL